MKPPQLLIDNSREIIIRVRLYIKRPEIILADFVHRDTVIVSCGLVACGRSSSVTPDGVFSLSSIPFPPLPGWATFFRPFGASGLCRLGSFLVLTLHFVHDKRGGPRSGVPPGLSTVVGYSVLPSLLTLDSVHDKPGGLRSGVPP